MFKEFARRTTGVKLIANMTEFGKAPSAAEFEAMGYAMVIWPGSALRVAAKAHELLYADIRRDGSTEKAPERIQTRAELYETIDYQGYGALHASIIKTIRPEYATLGTAHSFPTKSCRSCRVCVVGRAVSLSSGCIVRRWIC